MEDDLFADIPAPKSAAAPEADLFADIPAPAAPRAPVAQARDSVSSMSFTPQPRLPVQPPRMGAVPPRPPPEEGVIPRMMRGAAGAVGGAIQGTVMAIPHAFGAAYDYGRTGDVSHLGEVAGNLAPLAAAAFPMGRVAMGGAGLMSGLYGAATAKTPEQLAEDARWMSQRPQAPKSPAALANEAAAAQEAPAVAAPDAPPEAPENGLRGALESAMTAERAAREQARIREMVQDVPTPNSQPAKPARAMAPFEDMQSVVDRRWAGEAGSPQAAEAQRLMGPGLRGLNAPEPQPALTLPPAPPLPRLPDRAPAAPVRSLAHIGDMPDMAAAERPATAIEPPTARPAMPHGEPITMQRGGTRQGRNGAVYQHEPSQRMIPAMDEIPEGEPEQRAEWMLREMIRRVYGADESRMTAADKILAARVIRGQVQPHGVEVSEFNSRPDLQRVSGRLAQLQAEAKAMFGKGIIGNRNPMEHVTKSQMGEHDNAGALAALRKMIADDPNGEHPIPYHEVSSAGLTPGEADISSGGRAQMAAIAKRTFFKKKAAGRGGALPRLPEDGTSFSQYAKDDMAVATARHGATVLGRMMGVTGLGEVARHGVRLYQRARNLNTKAGGSR